MSNFDAQFGRIWEYYYSSPSEKDYRKAARMFQELAALDHAPSIYALPMAYYDGKGVCRSYARAFDLIKQAAERGYPEAQNMLGAFYESPRRDVCPQDYAKAAEWYERSARAGNSSAQYNFARLLASGWGRAKDLKEAYVWHSLSVMCTPMQIRNRASESQKEAIARQLMEEELDQADKEVESLQRNVV